MQIKVALVSPYCNAYSETFIRAQRDLLPFVIKYYCGGSLPIEVDGVTINYAYNRLQLVYNNIKNKFGSVQLSIREMRLANSFKRNAVDVVLAQYGPTGEALWRICKYLDIPLIVHFHGYDSGVRDVLEKYKNYQALVKNAERVIAVSNAMEAQLLNLGFPQSKIIKITYGPANDFLNVQPEYNESHFIGIGRFTDKKAPYYTILAFKKVVEKFPCARLTICGDGVLLNACKNLVSYLGLVDSVCLPGVVTPDQYRKYLKTSLAFVQHSVVTDIGDTEGTPLAVLEASAAGLPVVSTKHAGIPDVIIDGVTGFLVDEHDVNGMANAMMQLLEDKELAMRLGSAGKVNISQNFSMDHYIDRLTSVITAVLR